MCGLCRLHERRLDQVQNLAGELPAESDEGPSFELTPEARDRLRDAITKRRSGAGTHTNRR